MESATERYNPELRTLKFALVATSLAIGIPSAIELNKEYLTVMPLLTFYHICCDVLISVALELILCCFYHGTSNKSRGKAPKSRYFLAKCQWWCDLILPLDLPHEVPLHCKGGYVLTCAIMSWKLDIILQLEPGVAPVVWTAVYCTKYVGASIETDIIHCNCVTLGSCHNFDPARTQLFLRNSARNNQDRNRGWWAWPASEGTGNLTHQSIASPLRCFFRRQKEYIFREDSIF